MQKKPEWKDVMSQEGLDDMTLLSKLTNDEIKKNLEERFMKDIIYTNIGDVLISVNPYKMLPIYSAGIIHDYVGKARIELPPHIYGVAEQAYRTMVLEGENQCILITGESGAGKTEAAKKIMEYIAEVSGNVDSAARLNQIKRVILDSNPLLEAFGNAKTLRNNNSSRFGKYFEIHFNRKGEPEGGVIINYLLEKSRVCYQIEGERNYHIFYQFCLGASPQEREEFGLHGPDAFEYLIKGNCLTVDGIDDIEEYGLVRNAMNTMNIPPANQKNIFQLISAILWMGNIDFSEKNDRAEVADASVLEFVATLLQVPPSFLKTSLEIREVETKHGMMRGTTYKVPLNYIQACATRDALSKAVYSKIFDYLVITTNKAMVTIAKDTISIGVLDIYGFEVFQKNGFEQFCINYVNEKLQQIFIEFTLRLEQEEYVKEGIQWTPIEFFNNKIVCELIEGKKPPGIFLVLDDVCRSVHGVAEGADKALMERLTQCSSNPHFQHRGQGFCVKHYAGDVVYEVVGLVEKNKDVLAKDLLECLGISQMNFLKDLFPERADIGDSKKAPTSAGFKIRTAANDLVATLSKATPHYVRCIKPNDEKRPRYFDGPRVLHQVRYLGLLDNIKVRRAGFAYRCTFDKFLGRYFLLSSRTCYAAKNIWKGDVLSGCRAILADCPFGPDQYQIGKTKIFIRTPESLFALEDLRINYYHNVVNRIKFAYRTWTSYRHECSTRIKRAYLNWKTFRNQCAVIVQRCYRDYKSVAAYADTRMKVEPLLQGKKERNRLSMASVRKFYGDYLEVKKRDAIVTAMGPGSSEKVIFSSKVQILTHPGLLSSNKLSPRFLVLTDQALYLIMVQKKKEVITHVLERRVPINTIDGVTMSPFADNFVVLRVTAEAWDVVLELDFKTELVAWLSIKGSVGQNVNFMDKIEYFKKKKSKNKIQFLKDELFKEALYKKDKIKIATGLPASSVPNSFQKEGFKFIGVGGGDSSSPTPAARGRATPSPRGGARGSPAPRGGAAARGGSPAPRGGASPAPRGGAAASPAPRGGAAATSPAPRGGAATSPAPRGGAAPRGGGAAPAPRAPPAAPAGPQCRALYPYDPVESDELTLREGDVITIIEKDGDWWRGNLNGKVGVFPANYVEEI